MTRLLIMGILIAGSTCSLTAQDNDTMLCRLAYKVKENLTGNILSFWSVRMADVRNGGFYGRMDGEDNIFPEAEKGGILNARILWTFSSAFRILHDSSYLETATYAWNYILSKFIDSSYGGTFRSLNYKGEPADTRKQTYSQAFFIYALSEYFLASGDRRALEEAKKIFYSLEKYCYDTENNGYFEVCSRDWRLTDDLLMGERDKTSRKTMNTHLHMLEAYANLYRAWPDPIVAGRLKNLLNIFLTKIIDKNSGHLIVFMDVRWDPTSSSWSYGHDIETSWLLFEAAETLENKKITGRVRRLVLPMLNAALEGSQEDGSLVYEKDLITGEVKDNRDWWPQAEAVTALVNAYELTGDKEWLNKALMSWNYIDRKLVDQVNGEWFNSILPSGEVNRRADKAGFWKCPYHNGRMCLEIIRRSGILQEQEKNIKY